MIFDTHAHYDDEAFDKDREKLLETMQSRGIEYIVNVGTNVATCKTTVGLVRRFPFVYGALGFHPTDIKDITEEDYKWLEKMLCKPKIVAVGEIGLDYYWNDNKDEQTAAFSRQMEIAKELELPIVIHSREAAQDTYDEMKNAGADKIGGVVHCFSYGKEMAEKFMDMGFYIGIGGVVTYKNAKKIKEVVEYMPLDRLVVETDCPYLTPVPNRGKRNDSFMLPYVVNEIAKIKGVTPASIIDITNANAKKLYGMERN